MTSCKCMLENKSATLSFPQRVVLSATIILYTFENKNLVVYNLNVLLCVKVLQLALCLSLAIKKVEKFF